MKKFRAILGRAQYLDWTTRQAIDAIFEEHRDRLITAYCAAIRLQYEIRRRNAMFKESKPVLDNLPESPQWYSAAVQILTCAPDDVQRWFLSLPEKEKDECVQAVLEDGGVVTDTGFFAELPPI